MGEFSARLVGVLSGDYVLESVALNREGVNVEDQLLVICGVDRLADQPDEPVLLIETKGDEVLLGVPAPSAIGEVAPVFVT